ncbi:MAG TPA: class I SAM-dependent methyltransferase [Pyrinomonadaceae bacterium]
MPYEIAPGGLRGGIKSALNAVLRPVGLEIASTKEKRIEDHRLAGLKQKGHWNDARFSEGLSLDGASALKFLNDTCLPYQSEFALFPQGANGDETRYFLQNGWFESVDAEILYGVLRRFQPARVVEVGSGFSTRVMRQAISDGELKTRITSIDPHANSSVDPYTDEYIKSPIEDVRPERILGLLDAGDVLFIDSSHTVKTGGDVCYLFLEVLPKLKRGTLIHIHDIFLPFDYPIEWVFEGWGWTEQYLVQAFLAYNQVFQILWPASYAWKYHREKVLSVLPNAVTTARPSSLWIMKVE